MVELWHCPQGMARSECRVTAVLLPRVSFLSFSVNWGRPSWWFNGRGDLGWSGWHITLAMALLHEHSRAKSGAG
ncbi:hypothetical protein HaLaN_19182, partial [Haematococcus lacustris]